MSPDGDLSPSGTTGVTRTVESPSLHWVQRTIKLNQPNWCLHFGWLEFGLIRPPLSSAFHLGKLGGRVPEKTADSVTKASPPLPDFQGGGHHGVSRLMPSFFLVMVATMVFPVFVYIYIYKYTWFYILDLVKYRKQTSKQKNPGTNGEWKKKRERIELVTALWFTKSVSLQMSWN